MKCSLLGTVPLFSVSQEGSISFSRRFVLFCFPEEEGITAGAGELGDNNPIIPAFFQVRVISI